MESSFQANEVLLLMTVGIMVMVLLALAFVLFFLLSQRKLRTEQQKAQEQQLRHQEQLLFSTIETQEEERRRIAKDLHDEVGSKLNVIHLNLHRLQKLAPEVPALGEAVGDLFGVIHETIGTARRISHDLLPPTLENFGLKAAIVELCEQFRHTGAVELFFETMQNDERPTEKIVELNLFRVLQELVSNSLRHGQATRVDIRLWLTPSEIRMEYQGNGKGFDLKNKNFKPGLGMMNIESRMKMIGAAYTLDSEPGKGFRADVRYVYPV